MQESVRLPGWLWIVLLVGGPLLAGWLETYFGASGWAAPVSALLVIVVAVAKAVQEYYRQPEEPPMPQALPQDAAARDGVVVLPPPPAPQRGLVDRILFG